MMLNRTIIVMYFIVFINLTSINYSGLILTENNILTNYSSNLNNNLIYEIDNEIDEGLYFNITSYSNTTYDMNYNNEIIIDNITNSYDVSFSESKSYLDLFSFKSSFIDNIKDLTSSFNVIKSGETIKFSLNNTIASNSLKYDIMQNLTGDEIISLDIINEKWFLNINDGKGYNAIVFHFDNSFTVKLFLDIFPLTEINSTNNLSLYKFDRNFEMAIKELSILVNTSLPTRLNSIEWIATLDKKYDYNLIMNKFSLFRPIYDFNILINNNSHNINENFYFEKNKSYIISVNDDIVSNISVYIEYIDKYLFFPKLYLNNISLLVEIKFDITYNNSNTNFSSKILFPKSFYNIRYYNYDTKKFVSLDTNSLLFNFNFTIISNLKSVDYLLDYDIDEIYQGERINISVSDRLVYTGIVIHENEINFIVGNKNNNSLFFSIPDNWPKGEIKFYIIDENYTILKINQNLVYSPSKVIFSANLKLDPKIRNIIPIRMKNLSSGLDYNPDYIISYFDNGSLRETYEGKDLQIIADEFNIGNHKLKLIVKKIGYKDHKVDLNFTIIENYPDIIIESNRDTVTNGTFKISISEYNWDVQTKLIINAGYKISEFIITDDFTKISVYNEFWKNETINLRFTFKFGVNSGVLEINVVLSAYYLFNNNTFGRDNNILFSIFSSSVIIVILFKYINYRKKNRLILF